MGTPDFAVPCLNALIGSGHDIAGVFTQPDKPKNRGRQLAAPPVKLRAQEAGLAVFQPESLKTPETQALLRALAPELIVVVAYGKILPQAVLDIPGRGCINVHASLLPKYRGAGPIQWSILNGETETGITTMYMARGVDTGDMLLQVKTAIGPDETADELHDRLSVLGAQVLTETIYQKAHPRSAGRRAGHLCADADESALPGRLFKTGGGGAQPDTRALCMALRTGRLCREAAEALPQYIGGRDVPGGARHGGGC